MTPATAEKLLAGVLHFGLEELMILELGIRVVAALVLLLMYLWVERDWR